MFKKLKLLLLLITCINSLLGQVICSGKKVILIEDGVGHCLSGRYTLVFEDNFDGNTLDTSKWEVQKGVIRDPEQKSTAQWLLPGNIQISDGILKLTAKRDTFLNQCFDLWINDQVGMQNFCKNFFFTAAEIWSKENFKYGKYEISCKLPKGKGLSTGFWMWAYKQQNEIDVFEFNNETDIFGKFDHAKLSKIHCMNSHNDYADNGKMEDCPTHYAGPDFSAAFHTFTLIWTPHLIEWYVDGELKRNTTLFYTMLGQIVDCQDLKKNEEYILNKAFPTNPLQIITGIGVQSKDNEPDGHTLLPASLEIDYIKYYKLE